MPDDHMSEDDGVCVEPVKEPMAIPAGLAIGFRFVLNFC